MWKERYKRTFWVNQAIILTICLLLSIHWKMPLVGIAVFWIVMEIGALLAQCGQPASSENSTARAR